MKTVLLLRHAKSDWASPGLADFDRPLAKRGLEDASRMGRVLANFGIAPDRIMSSPARRAKQTAELVADACEYKKPIIWDDGFYGAGPEDLIEALQRLPDSLERVMLVGHNPTMEETVTALLMGDEAGAEDRLGIKMPTAALICLELPVGEWATLEPGQAILNWFLIPKLVKAIE
jgi:phosphohistidine phosphatase